MSPAQAKTPSGVSHDFVDHTSEVTVRARAPTFGELLEEMARAFVELVPEHLRGHPSEQWRELRFEGSDRAGVLVRWLNELVYLADADLWIPDDLQVTVERAPPDSDSLSVHVRARGRELAEPFVLVKAATLHGASVRDENGGCSGEVTLDI